MDSVEIKRLAENWFRPRLFERIKGFRQVSQTKLGEFASRGFTASPHMYGAIQISAEEEIALRGGMIFEGYAMALETTAKPITAALQQEIARDIETRISAESEQVRGYIQHTADRCKIAPEDRKNAAALRAATVAKIAADFDLLCAKWNSGFASTGMRSSPVAKNKPTRPRRPARTEKQVWQEAGSCCVFCPERDVSALQVHHIDSDPANNAIENLILACATCHAKITAGVISEAEVITRKRQLRFEPQSPLAVSSQTNAGNVTVDRTINTGTIAHTVNKFTKGRAPRMHYPPGTIGSDAMHRNYIDYLIKRYFEFRKADKSYGSKRPFSFAVVHTNIEKDFGAKTFFVLLERFDGLSRYLQNHIDNTILGRNKRSRGSRSYKTFAEYQTEQMNAPATGE